MGENLGILPPRQEDDCPYIKGQLRMRFLVYPTDQKGIPREPDRNFGHKLIPLGFYQDDLSVTFNSCRFCAACLPLRIKVKKYPFTVRNLHTLNANKDLVTAFKKPDVTQEHYDLYTKYISRRHPGESVKFQRPQADGYDTFKKMMSTHSGCIENRLNGKLVAYSVFDEVENGINGFYSVYDPDLSDSKRSLGTLANLQIIALTESLGHDYFYLGNWVRNSPKLDYKKTFRNLEAFTDKGWVSFNPNTSPVAANPIKTLQSSGRKITVLTRNPGEGRDP